MSQICTLLPLKVQGKITSISKFENDSEIYDLFNSNKLPVNYLEWLAERMIGLDFQIYSLVPERLCWIIT